MGIQASLKYHFAFLALVEFEAWENYQACEIQL